jgi:hypothetical protein
LRFAGVKSTARRDMMQCVGRWFVFVWLTDGHLGPHVDLGPFESNIVEPTVCMNRFQMNETLIVCRLHVQLFQHAKFDHQNFDVCCGN